MQLTGSAYSASLNGVDFTNRNDDVLLAKGIFDSKCYLNSSFRMAALIIVYPVLADILIGKFVVLLR